MRRTVVAFLAIFGMMTSTSPATVTRTKTMGRVGNWVFDDENILAWPSTVASFSNRFFLELGEDDAANAPYDPAMGPAFPNGFGGGALYGLSDSHHIGFLVTGDDRSSGGGISDEYFPDDPATGLPMTIDDLTTLFYGYRVGHFDLGANVTVGQSRSEQRIPPPRKYKVSVARVGFQWGATYWTEKKNSVAVTVQYAGTSITEEDANRVKSEDDGFYTLATRARMFWNCAGSVQLIPYVEYLRENRGIKRDSDGDGRRAGDKTETTSFDVALGINNSPGEKIQLIFVGGIRFSDTHYTTQGEDAGDSGINKAPYLKAGIDAGLRDWLNLRAGVEKQLFSSDSSGTVSDAVGLKATGAGYQGYIGAGINLGGWSLDAQINPALFFDGPSFIGGDAGRMNTRISIVRAW